MTDPIRTERRGAVLEVTLDRPRLPGHVGCVSHHGSRQLGHGQARGRQQAILEILRERSISRQAELVGLLRARGIVAEAEDCWTRVLGEPLRPGAIARAIREHLPGGSS